METTMEQQKAESHLLTSSALPPATGSTIINVGPAERVLSVIGGGIFTILGFKNIRSKAGVLAASSGALLIARGLSGFCPLNKAVGRNTANRKASAMEVHGTFTINTPRGEVYAYWRNFENLPSFMHHLEHVKVEDERRSTWQAKVPGGLGTVKWEAVINDDSPNELISWASLPGSLIDNAGEVRFSDAPGNRGTEIRAKICYRLPAGDVGSLVGKLFNPVVEQLVKEDLRRFKSLLETGEIPTTDGQPSGRAKDKARLNNEDINDNKKDESQNIKQNYESTVLERY